MGRRKLFVGLLLALAAGLAAGNSTRQLQLEAKRKIDMIQNEQAPRGATILLTAPELVAYAEGELPEVAPGGIREPRLELAQATAVGHALVDFVKLRQSKGQPPGWFLSHLLSGERPVSVRVQVQSHAGKATVTIERVEVSGLPISGMALDFLIDNFLRPIYPDAKIGEPFELGHNVERIDVRERGVSVIIAR